MIKKILITLVFTLFFGNLSLAAGGDGSSTKSNYDKAVKLIKSAKKYEADGKTKKADDRFPKNRVKTIVINIFFIIKIFSFYLKVLTQNHY